MSCTNYFQHHLSLLEALYKHCQQQTPFATDQASETDQEFLTLLQASSEAERLDDQLQAQGQTIVSRIISNYPHITPQLNRDLLWFFGGECLHFMADEELDRYQQLDELLNSDPSTAMSYAEAKAVVFQLH
jgi:hypothetical protein